MPSSRSPLPLPSFDHPSSTLVLRYHPPRVSTTESPRPTPRRGAVPITAGPDVLPVGVVAHAVHGDTAAQTSHAFERGGRAHGDLLAAVGRDVLREGGLRDALEDELALRQGIVVWSRDQVDVEIAVFFKPRRKMSVFTRSAATLILQGARGGGCPSLVFTCVPSAGTLSLYEAGPAWKVRCATCAAAAAVRGSKGLAETRTAAAATRLLMLKIDFMMDVEGERAEDVCVLETWSGQMSRRGRVHGIYTRLRSASHVGQDRCVCVMSCSTRSVPT